MSTGIFNKDSNNSTTRPNSMTLLLFYLKKKSMATQMLWNKIFLFQFIRIVMDGIMILDHGAARLRAFLCHWLHYNTWIVILRTFSIMQWYFTQLTVTLLNCRKVWCNLSHISSRFSTIFCKWNHCDGSTSGFHILVLPCIKCDWVIHVLDHFFLFDY